MNHYIAFIYPSVIAFYIKRLNLVEYIIIIIYIYIPFNLDDGLMFLKELTNKKISLLFKI